MTRVPGSAEAPGHPDLRPRRPADMSDLLPRLASGLVMVTMAVSTAVAGGFVFASFWWIAGVAVLWEWQRLIDADRLWRRVAAGAVAITVATIAGERGFPAWAGAALVCGGGVVAAQSARPLLGGAGVLYAGLLPLALPMLRRSDTFGIEAVFWLFAVVWGTDIMAYFGGRFIGGVKLWPRVSPSKTWSGFLVGIASGSLAGVLVAALLGRAHGALVPLGLVAGIVAQGGDLFESSFKRRFGVKDSSRLIPGHGGVMDRLDGFLVATVVAAGFGVLRAGADQSAAGLLQW